MNWKPISDLERHRMQFVLVHEDGAQRLYLWNPRGFWEHQCTGQGRVTPYDECSNPTHFMELPENPS